jgi:hypothetical protein
VGAETAVNCSKNTRSNNILDQNSHSHLKGTESQNQRATKQESESKKQLESTFESEETRMTTKNTINDLSLKKTYNKDSPGVASV